MHCLRKCVLNPDVTAKWFGIKHLFDLAKDVMSFSDLIEAQPYMTKLSKCDRLPDLLLLLTFYYL